MMVLVHAPLCPRRTNVERAATLSVVGVALLALTAAVGGGCRPGEVPDAAGTSSARNDRLGTSFAPSPTPMTGTPATSAPVVSWAELTAARPVGPARLAPAEPGQVVEWRCASSDRTFEGLHRHHLDTRDDWLSELPEGIRMDLATTRNAVLDSLDDPSDALGSLFSDETTVHALVWLLSDDRVPRHVRSAGLRTLDDRAPTVSSGADGLVEVGWTTGDRTFSLSLDSTDLRAHAWGWGPANTPTPDEIAPGRPPGTWPGSPAELRCDLEATTVEPSAP